MGKHGLALVTLVTLQAGLASCFWPFKPAHFTTETGNWTKVTEHCAYEINAPEDLICYDPEYSEIADGLEKESVVNLYIDDFDDKEELDLCVFSNSSRLQAIYIVTHEISRLKLGSWCVTPFENRVRSVPIYLFLVVKKLIEIPLRGRPQRQVD